jgi:hypothetical protein
MMGSTTIPGERLAMKRDEAEVPSGTVVAAFRMSSEAPFFGGRERSPSLVEEIENDAA